VTVRRFTRLRKRRVFVSFDYDQDVALKNLVVGQARLPDSPFAVIDHSLKEACGVKKLDRGRKPERLLGSVGARPLWSPDLIDEKRTAGTIETATCSRSMGAPGLVGGLLVDSGGPRGPVASTSGRRNRNHESTRPSDHRADGLSVRTRRVVDRFDVVGGRRVVAGRGRCFLARSPFKVAQSDLLVGSKLAGDQAVRLKPQELSPGRPDPAWRRAEAAVAKHRGDSSWRRHRSRASRVRL